MKEVIRIVLTLQIMGMVLVGSGVGITIHRPVFMVVKMEL